MLCGEIATTAGLDFNFSANNDKIIMQKRHDCAVFGYNLVGISETKQTMGSKYV